MNMEEFVEKYAVEDGFCGAELPPSKAEKLEALFDVIDVECERRKAAFHLLQIKEKYGGLRIYYALEEGTPEPLYEFIDGAIALAEATY